MTCPWNTLNIYWEELFGEAHWSLLFNVDVFPSLQEAKNQSQKYPLCMAKLSWFVQKFVQFGQLCLSIIVYHYSKKQVGHFPSWRYSDVFRCIQRDCHFYTLLFLEFPIFSCPSWAKSVTSLRKSVRNGTYEQQMCQTILKQDKHEKTNTSETARPLRQVRRTIAPRGWYKSWAKNWNPKKATWACHSSDVTTWGDQLHPDCHPS